MVFVASCVICSLATTTFNGGTAHDLANFISDQEKAPVAIMLGRGQQTVGKFELNESPYSLANRLRGFANLAETSKKGSYAPLDGYPFTIGREIFTTVFPRSDQAPWKFSLNNGKLSIIGTDHHTYLLGDLPRTWATELTIPPVFRNIYVTVSDTEATPAEWLATLAAAVGATVESSNKGDRLQINPSRFRKLLQARLATESAALSDNNPANPFFRSQIDVADIFAKTASDTELSRVFNSPTSVQSYRVISGTPLDLAVAEEIHQAFLPTSPIHGFEKQFSELPPNPKIDLEIRTGTLQFHIVIHTPTGKFGF